MNPENARVEPVDESHQSRDLRLRTKRFVQRIVHLYAELKATPDADIIAESLLRSATSAMASYRAATHATSRADFIEQIEATVRELKDVVYWLQVLANGDIIAETRSSPLLREADELIGIFDSAARGATDALRYEGRGATPFLGTSASTHQAGEIRRTDRGRVLVAILATLVAIFAGTCCVISCCCTASVGALALIPDDVEGGSQGSPRRSDFRSLADDPYAELLAAELSELSTNDTDYWALHGWLVTGDGQPASREPVQPPPTYSEGDVHEFWMGDEEEQRYWTIDAELLLITDQAYFYLDTELDPDMEQIETVARLFADIYPTNQRTFGTERRPGIDNDERITILITDDMPTGVAGYFSSTDEYPRAMKPRSNEREMIYLTASYLGDEDSLGQLLSHELQHMIHWNQDISEALWVNEGLSLLAEEVNGYGYVLGRRQFSNNPDIQLTNWAEDPQDRYRNYAASKLFLSYLSEHHGGHEHLALLVSDPADGVAGVENVLASTSSRSSSFDAVFADWAVANLLHDSSVADGRFSYALHTGWDPETTASLSASEAYTGWVRQYGVDYVEIKGAGATLTVTGSGLASLTSATPASGEFAWWSYRRNMLDSRLTRQVDLTSVDQATLRFSTWYDIEGDFDYGYVAVSLDEGQSWQTLTGTHTTSSDPNAANYGRGYTGRSARWLQETIDLSSFCGQHVLLRFWYITDPGLNRPGWLIDDIAIPEIGFRDDAETPADGWTAEGFVRSANDVPQTYQVLLVEFRDDGAHVRSLTMQDSLGSVTLSEAAPRAVLLVAGTARWTSELAPYKVEVAP